MILGILSHKSGTRKRLSKTAKFMLLTMDMTMQETGIGNQFIALRVRQSRQKHQTKMT